MAHVLLIDDDLEIIHEQVGKPFRVPRIELTSPALAPSVLTRSKLTRLTLFSSICVCRTSRAGGLRAHSQNRCTHPGYLYHACQVCRSGDRCDEAGGIRLSVQAA